MNQRNKIVVEGRLTWRNLVGWMVGPDRLEAILPDYEEKGIRLEIRLLTELEIQRITEVDHEGNNDQEKRGSPGADQDQDT